MSEQQFQLFVFVELSSAVTFYAVPLENPRARAYFFNPLCVAFPIGGTCERGEGGHKETDMLQSVVVSPPIPLILFSNF